MNAIESFTRMDVAYDQFLTASVQMPIQLLPREDPLFAKIHSAVDLLKEIRDEVEKRFYQED